MKKIKILLVDDHAVLRSGLKLLLNAQPDMEVLDEATDGLEAINKAVKLFPDIVLMDISMPGIGGLEAAKRIKAKCPKTKILVLTMHDDEKYLDEFLRHGASGYVVKKAADTELTAAIRAVNRGEIALHPAVTKKLINNYLNISSPSKKKNGQHDHLSEREQQVLKLIVLGHTNKEISEALFISIKTVETHRTRILQKLNLNTRAQLVQYAMGKGIFKKS
ncbi:MAG: DNA-binding response regulator [Candidatus Schekmanbacteria bacterium RIFCSPHIGHO2_02_FULL_38_11]|uniref:DNA-binding response regulator n=1 Tax=Candidatus Schekmanbacteria bacterium RIFCSPLOWO2_12_FULL_38_15 TaxID=1817883 RepID=A0A1F7SNS9_9BACT|nr:MAG: DNA-binding response regulator [Candidatus Schekmanbacteria bacterium GWA2_38_9]OGL48502.1 MAG: DNA-binding response regulator [Candidatus Schekmanbacteria bacterium RIFCSPHIGHO2_02_FULL_38_11]OGL50239.1 MAG: DNA-binding response regulator [Candidatus Schekmanbacteria bacterium RIFCSPLOWO2_02_FULL_38_14]OGL55450.1 MAG: DNA-binding response regulator [Candidatus Schekmanbacteria bacterium RIFCSPLOWO2_12_FULL_38_15]